MLRARDASFTPALILCLAQPENFLLSSKGSDAQLKATDFGLSRFFVEGKYMDEIVGSPFYVAPEVRNCTLAVSTFQLSPMRCVT